MSERAKKHLHWAKQNHHLAGEFEQATDSFEADWCITILFYAAVHYVDAYLAARSRRVQDHEERERQIADDGILEQIHSAYMNLKRMSREARYEMADYTQTHVEKAKKHLQSVSSILEPHFRHLG